MSFLKHKNLIDDVLLITVGIVGALGAVMIIYQNFVPVHGFFLKENTGNVELKKSQILATVSLKNLLTLEQKNAIISDILGDKVKMYGFSDDELEKILEALNKN